MNRIGSRILLFGKETTVENKNNLITIQGPKGVLKRQFNQLVAIKINNQKNQIFTSVENHHIRFNRSILGTTNSHIKNMIEGVEKGYKVKLFIEGVGYRAACKDNKLTMTLGFSHPVHFDIPTGVGVTVARNTALEVTGIDKEKVTAFAARIKAKKRPEPYLGKGIKYENEKIIRKVGKTANK